jgi:hypothetical protein
MIVYNTQNHWVYELSPSFGIQKLEYKTMDKVRQPSDWEV